MANYNEELENLESEGLEEEDIEQARIEKPESPDFPFLIFLLALTKDIIDWLDGGIILGVIANIVITPIMFLYMRNKIGYVQRWMYRRYIFTAILEFIPFINLIPQNAIFVVRAHLKEYEQVDKVLSFIESFAKGKPKIA